MKIIILFIFLYYSISCNGQQSYGTEQLLLKKSIPLPRVSGRIDHLAINLKENRVYVAALENNTVEVVDLDKGSVIHTITGLEEPQGVCYLPAQNELAVANGGNGNCIFYNAATYAAVTTVHLGGDADNIRYDANSGKLYVGYGDGGIAIIDAATHRQTGNVALPAHPESFQIDSHRQRLYVNLRGNNSIAVINISTMKVINSWKTNGFSANFPMALDSAGNHIFIGFRHPATLVGYDATTGKEQFHTALAGDADDLFFYEKKQEIVASGGDGFIDIFKKENNTNFTKIAAIHSRPGARTSLLIPSLATYIVAARAAEGKPAALVVYQVAE